MKQGYSRGEINLYPRRKRLPIVFVTFWKREVKKKIGSCGLKIIFKIYRNSTFYKI